MEATDEQIKSLYRFADRLDEVNWNARYRPNNDLMMRLMPRMYDFVDNTIREMTFNPDCLSAVVGISGGIDSAVTAWITAETMRRARKAGTAKETSLVMLAFNGLSEEDLVNARRFSEEISSEFRDIPLTYAERDLRPLLKEVDSYTGEIITSTERKEKYSGELSTRLIYLVLLEYADRTSHCLMDPANGSEIVLGEFVVGCGVDCSPISDLYKSQVYDIAELIGIPRFIIDRPPINSTFGNDKIRSYFGEIPEGLSPRDVYRVLDPILHLAFIKKMKPPAIARRLGHSLSFVEKVHQRIKNQDNRRNIPYFAITNTSKRVKTSFQDPTQEEMRKLVDESLIRDE